MLFASTPVLRRSVLEHRSRSSARSLRIRLVRRRREGPSLALCPSRARADLSRQVRTRYSRCVKSWWPIGIAVVAALVIGAIGLVAGLLLARRSRRELVRTRDETRREERRAAAYLEAAIGWHAYLQTLRPLAFPEDRVAARRQRDLAAVLRSRAQLELFGSPAVQQLHEETLDQAVTLIDLLRSMPMDPQTGEPDLAGGRYVLRFVLGEIGRRVDALERQMSREVENRAAPASELLELTGRRRAGQTPASGGKLVPYPSASEPSRSIPNELPTARHG